MKYLCNFTHPSKCSDCEKYINEVCTEKVEEDKHEFGIKHFFVLQVLDVLTTYIGLTYLGLTEQNTFANGLFETHGLVFALVSMKIVGVMVIYGLVQLYPTKPRNLAITCMCVFFIGVILNNVYWMFHGS